MLKKIAQFHQKCSLMRDCSLFRRLLLPEYTVLSLDSGINVGPTFINFGFFSRPYSLIKGPTFIKFWNFYQGLQKFSSLMAFLLHKFAHFVHALRLFKALWLFFLKNFPGPTVIPCPTSILDSRVGKNCWFCCSKMFQKFQILKNVLKQEKTLKTL